MSVSIGSSNSKCSVILKIASCIMIGNVSIANADSTYRLDNPCIGTQSCEWEETVVHVPVGKHISPQNLTRGVDNCLLRTDPTCPINTKPQIVYIKKKDNKSKATGSKNKSSKPSISGENSVESAALLPNHHERPVFSWSHPNGKPVHPDHKFRTKDIVELRFSHNRSGHLYLVNIDVAGEQSVLSPNPDNPNERSNFIAGSTRVLPAVQFVGRTGVERVYAIFSKEPIDQLSAFVHDIHRKFNNKIPDQPRLQAGTFNREGETSDGGIILSENLQPVTRGLSSISSSYDTNNNKPQYESITMMNIDPLMTERHPFIVLAIDLIHVSP